nr:RNA polymerase sigma factor [Paenibacillus lycopersici]
MNAVESDYLKHVMEMDAGALRDTMDRYGQDVWNYAFFLTGARDLADDIAQDVFIKAYYRIGSYRGQSSFKTWLLAITRNTAFSYRRSAFLRKVKLLPHAAETGTAASAENEYLDAHYTDEIWDIIMALPARYREVLVLDIRYGLTGEEIAALLGIAHGTVKSRLHRARAKVQRQL